MNGLSYILRNFDTLVSGQLQRAFNGLSLDHVVDSKHGIWEVKVVENDYRGTGKVLVKSDKQEFVVLFKPGQDYPDVLEGYSPVSVDAKIINGRISASSVDKDDKYIDTLPNPRINTDGLTKKEILSLKKELEKYNIFYMDGYKYIELLVAIPPDDMSIFNKYSNRIYYQTAKEDTPTSGYRESKEVHQTKQDREVDNTMPIGSVDAVKIMSETPVYINRTLIDSLPKITDEYSVDTTVDVLNSIDKRTFERMQKAYSSEGIQEILYDKDFISSYKRGDLKTMREILGLKPKDKLSESMEVLFGVSLKEFGHILDVAEDPIQTEDGYINVFNNKEIDSLSKALTLSDQYLRYNDVYDAKYNMFTSRGERMYAEGSDNFQANKEIRKNVRFEPTDPKDIDRLEYVDNLMEAIGGALVEDGLVKSDKHKITNEELIDIATKYTTEGNFKDATPRIQNYLKALHNVDNFGVLDTGTSVTMDATFSGLVVNSAITGKTSHLDKVNVSTDGERKSELNDLYSEVGKSLINKLVENGLDHKEARSLVKPGVMTAMYNSSENARRDNMYKAIRETLISKYGKTETENIIAGIKDEINETVSSATDVLASTIKEKEVLDLVNKGIITVYERGDVGEPVAFTPEDIYDLDRVAGVRIAKPDGTASLIVNGQDEVMAVGDKLVVVNDDHVVPFTEVTRSKEDGLEIGTNHKKLLDNVSTAIARTYDSYVASYVVEKLHDEGIPVLTTHDAFTVPVYAMNKAKDYYNEVVNNIYKFGGSDVVVDARDNLSVE